MADDVDNFDGLPFFNYSSPSETTSIGSPLMDALPAGINGVVVTPISPFPE
jgi:hypothetical protein